MRQPSCLLLPLSLSLSHTHTHTLYISIFTHTLSLSLPPPPPSLSASLSSAYSGQSNSASLSVSDCRGIVKTLVCGMKTITWGAGSCKLPGSTVDYCKTFLLFIPHTLYPTLHTPYFIPHTSCPILHTPYFICHTSYPILHAPRFIPHTSYPILHTPLLSRIISQTFIQKNCLKLLTCEYVYILQNSEKGALPLILSVHDPAIIMGVVYA